MASFFGTLKRVLVGRPFRSGRIEHMLLPKRLAFPVYAADALSSVAYAADEIILTLAVAGATAVTLSPWVGLAVVVVMLTVIFAYGQNVREYPSGGGDYEIVSKNLGPKLGVTVAAALLTDYVLTLAVSISAAATYLSSAIPGMEDHTVALAVLGVFMLTLFNLRGVRTTGKVSAVPTYVFIVSIVGMCLLGAWQATQGTLRQAPSAQFQLVADSELDAGLLTVAGFFLVLRAFSSGASALTGVEALSNGVPTFQKPKGRNAALTLLALGAVSSFLLMGVLFLAKNTGVLFVADPQTQLSYGESPISSSYRQEPVLSQLAETIFPAGSLFFYVTVLSIGAVLCVAGNTVFNGFPNLASILAKDGFLPRQLRVRGDRLGFSNGIVLLAVGAVLLILVFHAEVTQLVQLYIVGVFVSFTLSQLGMIRHWLAKYRLAIGAKARWRVRRSLAVNGFGFVMTATVLVIVVVTKFQFGAWIAVVAMAVLFTMMTGISKHYRRVEAELAVDQNTSYLLPSRTVGIVVVTSVNKAVLRTVAYARGMKPSSLEAILVDVDHQETEKAQAQWQEHGVQIPLTILGSPFRATIQPLLAHVKSHLRAGPRDIVVVFLPEYVNEAWWSRLLHNQLSSRISKELKKLPRVVVTAVPWQMFSEEGEPIANDPRIAQSTRSGK